MVKYFGFIIEYLRDYALKYFFFLSEDYYSNLFSKYFSIQGFIVGFIFVMLIYFACSEVQENVGFFKVLPFVAVINSCMVLFTLLNTVIGDEFYGYSPGMLGYTDNIVSGFVLVLVILSCYKGFGGRAFVLGIVVYAAIPFLYFEYLRNFESESIVQMVIRVVLAGFLCAIISNRKYFYTSWILYFVYHITTRTIALFMPMLWDLVNGMSIDKAGYSASVILDY